MRVVAMAWTAALMAMSGCTTPPPTSARTPLVVLAASSLSGAMSSLERRYEATHPRIDVQITTAGSQTLRMQLEQGLRGDVFASANLAHLSDLQRQGLSRPAQPLARNELVVAVRDDSPLRDARKLDTVGRLAVGTTQVPIGAYTQAALMRADADFPGFSRRVRARVVSEEPNVRLTLAKVALGQADAAVVYRTDVLGGAGHAAKLRGVALPSRWQVDAHYGVAALVDAPQPRAAAAWIAWLRGAEGQRILRDHGFLPADALPARPAARGSAGTSP